MPIYEYRCECGKMFEEQRLISDRETPAICECGKAAPFTPFCMKRPPAGKVWWYDWGHYGNSQLDADANQKYCGVER